MIITLWMVAVLAMLSVAVSRQLAIEMRLVRRRLELAKAQAMAEGAIRYGLLLLKQDQQLDQADLQQQKPVADWLHDEWAGRTSLAVSNSAGAASASLQIVDEERKVDLNVADLQQLIALGLPTSVAQAIIDYHTPAPAEEPKEEPSAGSSYRPKGGPLKIFEELSLIPAIQQEPALLESLKATTTVSPTPAVNINTASEEALRAIAAKAGGPPIDTGLWTSVVNFRPASAGGDEPRFFFEEAAQLQSTPPFEQIDTLRQAKELLSLGTVSNVFTLTATVPMSERLGGVYAIEAVASRSQECAADATIPRMVPGMCVLTWRESLRPAAEADGDEAHGR